MPCFFFFFNYLESLIEVYIPDVPAVRHSQAIPPDKPASNGIGQGMADWCRVADCDRAVEFSGREV